jgi:hypothetical protein
MTPQDQETHSRNDAVRKSLTWLTLLALPVCGQRQNYSQISNGPGVPITQYGALPGAADSLAAFNAAYAANDNVMVPAGIWNLSSGNFIMNRSNTSLRCETGATIVYTGTSPIDSVVTVGAIPQKAYNLRVENCAIRGNSHAASALHIYGADHSVFRDLQIKDAVTAVLVEASVSTELENIEISALSGRYTFEPSYGIDVTGSNTINIISPTVEYIALSRRATNYPGGVGTGIRIRNNSRAIKITGGTSESNNIGVSFDTSSWGCTVDTMDDENNEFADVDVWGKADVVTGGLLAGTCDTQCTAPTHVSVHFESTAEQGLAEAFIGSIVQIDAGAKGTTVRNTNLGNVACCLVNNGTFTTLLSNYNCCGSAGGPLSNLIAGAPLPGSPASNAGDRGAMTPQAGPTLISDDLSGSNNALIAFLKDANGNPVPVVPGLRVTIRLTHSLGAGLNTLDLNGSGAMPIVKPTDGTNLTVPYIGSGLFIDLMNYAGTKWVAMAAQ